MSSFSKPSHSKSHAARKRNTLIDDKSNLKSYENIIQLSSNIFYEHDIQGNYIYISPQIKNILGYTPEEANGKWSEMLSDHPENQIGIKSTQRAIETGKQQPPYELELLTKSGDRIWLEIREAPIIENGKVVSIIGASLDITESKKFDTELIHSEKNYRLLVENQNEILAKFDLKGRLIYVSPNYCEIFNVKHENIIGKKFIPKVHPADQKKFEQVIEKSLIEPFNIDHEERMKTVDGWRWFAWSNKAIRSEDGSVGEIVSVGRDISKQKDVEDEINKLAFIAKETDNAVIIAGLDTNIEWVNDSFTRISGYKLDEVFGQNPITLLSGNETDQDTILRIVSAIRKGEKITEELINYGKNGQKYWVEITIKPIHDEKGNIIKYFSIQTDITERKKADLALEESVQKYQMLTEISPVGIFRTEPDGYTTYVNPRWCEISGMKAEDALGDGWLRAVNPEDQKILMKGWRNATKRRSESSAEYRFIRPNGEIRWVLGNATPELNYEGKISGYVGTVTDITENKEAENKLRVSEARLKEAQRIANIGNWEWDLINDKLWFSDQNYSVFGLEPNEIEVSYNIFLSFVIEEDREYINKILDKVLRGKQDYEFDCRIVRKDGEKRIIHIRGETYFGKKNVPIRLAGYTQDITFRKHAEQALKLSEEKFSKAFYSSPDSITLTRAIDGKIIDANNGFVRIFGYSRKEALGKSTIDLKLWKNSEDRDNAIRILRTEGRVKDYVAEYNSKNKKNGVAEVSMELLKIGGEDLLLTIVRDITERKKIERDLIASEEKFATAFYSSPDAKSISKLSDGSIMDINPIFEKMFGFSRNDIIGKSTADLNIYKNPQDRERVYKILQNSESVKNMEAVYKTKNNEAGIAKFSIEKINIAGDRCLLTSIRNITDQKRIQKEIEEYQKNLKSLTSEITLAEEKERRRIAINLHDHLGQSLAMSKIKLAESQKETEVPLIINKVNVAKKYLDDAIKNSRLITYELSPPVLYELGFSAAIRWRLDQVKNEHNLNTRSIIG